MSRRAAAVLLTATVLSGCGTGLQAQTYKETGRSDGASADLEALAIRDLHIEAPTSGTTLAAGSSAVLTGTLVNHGSAQDTLTAVTSDAASTVTLAQDDHPATSIAIPAGGADSTWTATLTGLSAAASAGSYISVTLTFSSAGQTTLQVPVALGNSNLDSREVNQQPYGEGG